MQARVSSASIPAASVPAKTLAPGVVVHPDHATLISLLDNAPLRLPHYVAWFLSSGGTLLDGFSVFMLGMAIPLVVAEIAFTTFQLAFLGAGLVAGAVLGAATGGRLADRIGRKSVFLLDMLFLLLAALGAALSWEPWFLIITQTLVGVAIGMDFPVSSSYIAECMPHRSRGRMMVATIASQSVGMLLAALLVLSLLHLHGAAEVWRFFFVAEALIAAFFLVARMQLAESPRWLMSKGRNREAVHAISHLIPEDRRDLEQIATRLANTPFHAARIARSDHPPAFTAIFSAPYRRRTFLSTAPWFLMDMATYGIGLFTAVLLGAMDFGAQSKTVSAHIEALTTGSGFIDLFLLLGFLVGIWAVVRFGRIRMQLIGFGGMALGMAILLVSTLLPGGPQAQVALVFIGFILFNLFMNMGPNSTTYVLPAELFPTQLRGTGAGFAAAVAKVGATLGVFLLPLIKARVGVVGVLVLMIAVSLLGLITTWLFRVDDRERTLEEHQAADLA